MLRMKLRLVVALATITMAAAMSSAQNIKCEDAANESHFSVVYENSGVRVLSVELGRIDTTKPFSYKRPHIIAVTTESRTTTTPVGSGGVTRDWSRGDVQFSYETSCRTLRNELSTPHRQIIVESYRPMPYDQPSSSNDLLYDLSAVKPTTATTMSRGALSATRFQIAPGDSVELIGGDQLVIALTDLDLEADGNAVRMASQEIKVLDSKASHLKNQADKPARLIVVSF